MNIRGNKRLLKLAVFLDKVPPKAFDLNSFIRIYRYDSNFNPTFAEDKTIKEVLTGILNKDERFDCGSTACAVGYMPIVFPDKFDYDGNSIIEIGGNNTINNFKNTMKYLGLNMPEMEYLFVDISYRKERRSAKCVANRIRKIVKEGFPKKVYGES